MSKRDAAARGQKSPHADFRFNLCRVSFDTCRIGVNSDPKRVGSCEKSVKVMKKWTSQHVFNCPHAGNVRNVKVERLHESSGASVEILNRGFADHKHSDEETDTRSTQGERMFFR
ncbi:hypothetical protein [Stieleria mannarensis]|uniref:hypothetical protein n=1 Tax=Stieleria mannarensis TaxID=2755585 RepID=UPI001C71DBB7|nr:hypothetical protein [Rhodopirellula sp. JC639]